VPVQEGQWVLCLFHSFLTNCKH